MNTNRRFTLKNAVLEGNIDKARELINRYGFPYLAYSDGLSLLFLAVKAKQIAMVKLLITNVANLNYPTDSKPAETLLQVAVVNGSITLVKMFLKKGIDVNEKNKYNRTALHYAIMLKKVKTVELLLKFNADANATDGESLNPLHLAANYNCVRIVQLLLNFGAFVNCVHDSKDYIDYTPLHFAVLNNCTEVVSLLLSSGAEVDALSQGTTPLHSAVFFGYYHIAEDLLRHGACVNSVSLMNGCTPFHCVKNDEESAIQLYDLLLSKGADINAKAEAGMTALHFAAKDSPPLLSKLLLERGANVDLPDMYGRTALHYAVTRVYFPVVCEILKFSPDVLNASNRSCVKIALGFQRDNDIVQALVEYGLSVNPSDASDSDLLVTAVSKGYFSIVEDMLKYGANVNVVHNGAGPLHIAAQNENYDMAKLLINYGADPNVKEKNGKIPLYYAISKSNFKMTQLFLEIGSCVKEHPELLLLAATKGCLQTIECLVQHGIDVNATNNEYCGTALHYSLGENKLNHDAIFNFLLSKGAEVDATDKYRHTVLHVAAAKGFVSIVATLLKHNANVNCVGLTNFTPLLLSIGNGHYEVAKMLLAKGADTNVMIESGTRALHFASEVNDTSMVRKLLNSGAAVNAQTGRDSSRAGATALHLASKYGHVNVVSVLLEHGADVNIINSANRTPLEATLSGICDYPDILEDNYSYQLSCPRLSRQCHKTAEEILRHVVKIKATNSYVCENIVKAIYKGENMQLFCLKLENEIEILKSEQVPNTNVALFDVLVKNSTLLAKYAMNNDILEMFNKSHRHLLPKFPEYYRALVNRFKLGIERKKVLLKICKNFSRVSDILPQECIENVLAYLNNENLRNLQDACRLEGIDC